MIPRILHQTWIGPKPRPAGLMETWRRLNPSYEYIVWDNDRSAVFGFENQRKIDEMSEWNGKADIMRYEILHRFGGILVDADSECLLPLPDEMLEHDSFACWENETARPGLVAAGYMGATRGNAFMRLLIDEVSRRDVRVGRAWKSVGPQLVTDMLQRSGYTGMHIYPSHYFIPEHLTGLRYNGPGPVYATQYWGSTNKSYDKLAAFATPLITCVMLTTHPKRERYLPDALRAFRQQTYADRELVIINDGASLVSHSPDIRVVNLPDRGSRWTIGEKRNVGIREARGEYLATWDDDDLSLPHRLATQMRALQSGNADVVLADRMLVADESLRVIGDCDRGRPMQGAALMSRNVAIQTGGYSASDYREDVEMLERIRYLVRGNITVMDRCDWYVLRRHETNTTSSFGEQNDAYRVCALHDPEVDRQQAQVDAVRAGPGGNDVT